MAKTSAGLLMYRRSPDGTIEVLLGHPGGPFWMRKDIGAWTLPKGEYTAEEDPQDAARREFGEETGFAVSGALMPLGQVRQAAGKIVTAWAFCGDCDPSQLTSNSFELEWPLRSGKMQTWPELDRAAWFRIDDARTKILPAQLPFLDRLADALSQ